MLRTIEVWPALGEAMLDTRLYHHLVTWLGQWPPGRGLTIVGSERRVQPGWDGQVHPLVGVGAPGGTVLSVPPMRASAVRSLADQSIDELLAKLPVALSLDSRRALPSAYRWSLTPASLPDAGEWLPADHPVVPEWLRPFGGEVLVARASSAGEYLAGVGLKRHDRFGQEIAVGTEPAARGQGLARRLVAQAARRVLDEGAVPTYRHALDNVASARVAEAAGFLDRGWRAYGLDDQ